MSPSLQFLLEHRVAIVIIGFFVACVILVVHGIATAQEVEVTYDDLLNKH